MVERSRVSTVSLSRDEWGPCAVFIRYNAVSGRAGVKHYRASEANVKRLVDAMCKTAVTATTRIIPWGAGWCAVGLNR